MKANEHDLRMAILPWVQGQAIYRRGGTFEPDGRLVSDHEAVEELLDAIRPILEAPVSRERKEAVAELLGEYEAEHGVITETELNAIRLILETPIRGERRFGEWGRTDSMASDES
jgi:hypothetical protein